MSHRAKRRGWGRSLLLIGLLTPAWTTAIGCTPNDSVTPADGGTIGGGPNGEDPAPPSTSACAQFAAACFDELPNTSLELVRFRPNSRWQKIELSWTITSFAMGVDDEAQRTEIQRAFDSWAGVANLRFVETPDDDSADIVIAFMSTDDATNMCDMSGGFLGRSFFPGTPQAGQIQLCGNAAWTVNSTDSVGFDVFTVALHEIGHVLGLEHAESPDAVMDASYDGAVSDLTIVDALAIQRIYGSPDGSVTPEQVRLPGEGVSEIEAFLAALDDQPDADEDGLPDVVETFFFGTDPLNDDSDGDGAFDFEELFVDGTPAARSGDDTDGDGLPDDDEAFFGTGPSTPDTDQDGLPDGVEVAFLGTDPTRQDTDNDGIPDGAEVIDIGSDPTDPDTDFDGLLDGEDNDPFDAIDSDEDGLPDGFEVAIVGTDPNDTDTDGDDLDDFAEFLLLRTDPLSADTDGDGIGDQRDVFFDLLFGTQPVADDIDGDGVRNVGEEVYLLSDPALADTDGDGVLDGAEGLTGTDPQSPDAIDSDGDGLTDIVETDVIGSDPFRSDSDGDGASDLDELRAGTDP